MTNTPLISVCIGTYNRAQTLRRLVESIRQTVSRAVALEIIIADNGSTDGTADWLAQQTDIRLIQFGKPVGAVKAFTEAAYSARGQFVLLATDDCWFPDHSIMTALAYLDSHPVCGAVTFAHNKGGRKHAPDVHPGRTEDGQKVAAVYPQIALVRRWLGDKVGWWGGRHEVMKDAFTYGGDNFLGAGIVELGYTVESVYGALENEDTVADEPRQMNEARHDADAALYRQLYPDGPLLRASQQMPNPDTEHLRIFLSLDYDPLRPHHKTGKIGLMSALARRGIVYDYDRQARLAAGVNTAADMAQAAAQFQPHFIFVQFHMPRPAFDLEHARALRVAAPSAVMVSWNGDYWPRNYRNPAALDVLRLFDLSLVQNAYFVDHLCSEGICALPFCHSAEPVAADRSQPAYDVIFTGNGYDESREALAQFLRSLPYKVGLYGGFKTTAVDGNSLYQFDKTYGLYANARIAISPMQFTDEAYGFTSNRTFEIMAQGGAVCLQQHAPGLDAVSGLKAGVHYAEWHTHDDLRQQIEYYLTHETARRRMARAALVEFQRNQSFDARVHWLLTEGMNHLDRRTDGSQYPAAV